MDEPEESAPALSADIETEVKEMMGLYDAPAFARRGHDLEITLRWLHEGCRKARGELLDMVQMRLRQWSGAVTGPAAWSGIFTRSIEPLWPLAAAEAPRWAEIPASHRRQQIIAADLVAAVVRFNRRWTQFLERLNLEPTNIAIDQYNRYYLLEKECVMGSARLAARHFQPLNPLTPSTLKGDHPTLPVPELVSTAAWSPARSSSPNQTSRKSIG